MDVIERAKGKREALLKEVRRLDDFIKMAESLDTELGGNGAVAVTTPAGKPTKKLSNKAKVEAGIAELIKTRGPIKKQEIFQGLAEMGLNPGTSNPKVMLSVLLSRADQFVNEKGKWRFAKGKGPTGVNH